MLFILYLHLRRGIQGNAIAAVQLFETDMIWPQKEWLDRLRREFAQKCLLKGA